MDDKKILKKVFVVQIPPPKEKIDFTIGSSIFISMRNQIGNRDIDGLLKRIKVYELTPKEERQRFWDNFYGLPDKWDRIGTFDDPDKDEISRSMVLRVIQMLQNGVDDVLILEYVMRQCYRLDMLYLGG